MYCIHTLVTGNFELKRKQIFLQEANRIKNILLQ